jgi:hypothetical protein
MAGEARHDCPQQASSKNWRRMKNPANPAALWFEERE